MLDLILGAGSRSDGSGRKGATAAALVAGKPFPRRRLAGDAQSGVPVAGLDSGLALGLVRGMRSPLGLRAGLDRGSGGVRDGAGCVRRSIDGARGGGAAHGARRRAAAESPEKVFWSYRAPFGPGFGRGGPSLNA